ncbi:MAG: DUF4350 domain-containing protein [Candidatus Thorarchaeota archaeon]|nr:MAG: DUF4350 domain-containing protein [Candidatus Thorarchaeota archaeon]
MARLKHVLVLTILILPMFALAPSLVAGPNEVLTNRAPVDSALPAQFVEQTLRVAVYAEGNTTLPLYASGGVSTAHHVILIQLLESNGYAVTALSTQDILDRKLMAASFDVFILPNNLPKDEIVTHVMDYWLAGGGILSFDSGLGYLYYHGMIVPADTGDYALVGVDSGPHWGFDYITNITIGERHSTAKSYQQSDIISVDENTTIHDKSYFNGANPTDFVPLFIEMGSISTTVGFALDNTARQGGRIVQLPGNCSYIPAWETSVIFDSIDWLAPRPKGRILVDFTHDNWIPIDAWDPYNEAYAMNQWRNGLVNRSYTVDKLHTSLTLDNLESYDMLVLPMSNANFSSQEVQAVQTWVANGGGLFVIGDDPGLGTIAAYSNYLLSPYDITFNLTSGLGPYGAVGTYTVDHPIHEGTSETEYGGFSYINVTGDAYPLWMYVGNIAAAGQEYGEGRIIVSSDGNLCTDTLGIIERDNFQYLMNVANWLTAARARILVYADSTLSATHPNFVPLNGPVAQALNDLGESFYMTSDIVYFNMSLFRDDYDMVVFDNNNWFTNIYQHHLIDFVEEGGKVVFNTWALDAATGDYFGVDLVNGIHSPPAVYLWESGHPIFNLPATYGETILNTTKDLIFGTDALNFTTYTNATPLAGYAAAPSGVAIAIGAGGNVIVNGPLLISYFDDIDDSTYPDNVELWINQIAFLYYDRPTINHPDDVTYMETETGNDITWTPTADAGPWEYVFSVNGTPVQGGSWTGAPLTFSVDGVNASITEYELTVFDKLGFGASDLVILDVTEFVPTTTPTTTPGPTTTTGPGGPPLDPTLVIIIGVAGAGVVIILVVVMQLKKKK